MSLNAPWSLFDSDRTLRVPSSLPPSGGADWAGAPALLLPRSPVLLPRSPAVAHPHAIAALQPALLAHGHPSPLAPVLGRALRCRTSARRTQSEEVARGLRRSVAPGAG